MRMTTEIEEALTAVWNAMDSHRENCISGDEYTKERIELGAQFNLIESTLADLWSKRYGRATDERTN